MRAQKRFRPRILFTIPSGLLRLGQDFYDDECDIAGLRDAARRLNRQRLRQGNPLAVYTLETARRQGGMS